MSLAWLIKAGREWNAPGADGRSRQTGLRRGVVENHASRGTQDIVENRFGSAAVTFASRRSTSTVSPEVVASAAHPRLLNPRGISNNPRSAPACSIAVRMSVSISLFQHDLARDGLRHLDHGREVEVSNRRPDRARRTRPLFDPQ